MAFDATKLLCNVTPAIAGGKSSAGSTALSPAQWYYVSSDASTACAVAGYFASQGIGSKGTNPGSMRTGDLVTVVESPAGNTPGRTTLHSVKTATANQASTSASSGFSAGYDVTIASTP